MIYLPNQLIDRVYNIDVVQRYTDEEWILSKLWEYETFIQKQCNQTIPRGIIHICFFKTDYMEYLIQSLLIGFYQARIIRNTNIFFERIYIPVLLETVAPLQYPRHQTNSTDKNIVIESHQSEGKTMFSRKFYTNYRQLAQEIVEKNKEIVDTVRAIGKQQSDTVEFEHYIPQNLDQMEEAEHEESISEYLSDLARSLTGIEREIEKYNRDNEISDIDNINIIRSELERLNIVPQSEQARPTMTEWFSFGLNYATLQRGDTIPTDTGSIRAIQQEPITGQTQSIARAVGIGELMTDNSESDEDTESNDEA
jgi:hypothetical protein